jgi:hypothetical protein
MSDLFAEQLQALRARSFIFSTTRSLQKRSSGLPSQNKPAELSYGVRDEAQ